MITVASDFSEIIWKDVRGYEGFYIVSNNGFVSRNGKIISQQDRLGYKKVSLCKSGRIKQIGVHRLVAKAFIINPENKPEVNHKNGNKSDNNTSNLEWCTRK